MKKLALHWKILLGMLLGVVFALIMTNFDFGKDFIKDWIKPFGTIFINSLKLIAIPLILAALIKGVSDLRDISKLSKMGGRTIGIYLITTVIAVSIGLVLVNIIKPGKQITESTRTEMVESYSTDTTKYKDEFNHDKFWQWCRDKAKEGHDVFISEYNAPDDFICVWQQELNVSVAKTGKHKKATEKLFVHESQVESDYESLY